MLPQTIQYKVAFVYLTYMDYSAPFMFYCHGSIKLATDGCMEQNFISTKMKEKIAQ